MLPRTRPIASCPETMRQQFDTLHEKFHRYPFHIARQMLHNASDAEEIAQEAWLRAWIHFDRYDPSCSFEGWLYSITRFLCLDFLRKTRRYPSYSLEALCAEERSEETPHRALADERSDPARWQTRIELRDAFIHALARLPKQQRLAINLLSQDDYTYEQMSEILHCPVGTVRSRLHRARLNMQQALSEAA